MTARNKKGKSPISRCVIGRPNVRKLGFSTNVFVPWLYFRRTPLRAITDYTSHRPGLLRITIHCFAGYSANLSTILCQFHYNNSYTVLPTGMVTRNMEHIRRMTVGLLLTQITLYSLVECKDTARVLVQGSPVNLSCNVTDVSATTIWLFGLTSESGDTVIAQGSVVYEKFSSQYELQVHGQENQYEMVLTVQNVTEDGIYTCQENGINKLQAHVTVEIPPQLMLKKDGVKLNESIDVVFTKEVQIQCVAAEGKPSVSLSWQVNGEEKTAGVTTDMSREDERIISSMINYIPNKDDATLSCINSGQEVIPSQQATVSINVMYAPSCRILVTNETSNQFRLICACDANPVVSGYKILVNNSLYREAEEVSLPSTDSAIVSCNASNQVGNGTSEQKKLEPFHVDQLPSTTRVALIVAIPAAFIVLVLCIGLIFTYRRARRAEQSIMEFLLIDLISNFGGARMNRPPPPENVQPNSQELQLMVLA